MGFASVKKIAEADFPTRWGAFRILGFEGVQAAPRPCAEVAQEAIAPNSANAFEIKSGEGEGAVEGLVALVMGDIHSAPPLVRIHSQCLTGDVFGSLRCDCRLQLELAMRQIAAAGAGILLYEQQEGRGIGLMAKLRAYELPAEVLKLLGVRAVRLITNNPEKVEALESAGITVAERVSAEVEPQESFAEYVRTKQEKMGHIQDSM
jgi:GTP cyclohydrolase II